MKFIKNNTDNNIIVKCLIEGHEESVMFNKSAVTELEDSIDTAFKNNSIVYANLFEENVLVYTVKPEEQYDDDYSRYFKGYTITNPVTKGTFKLCFDKVLVGTELYLIYAKDGSETVSEEVTLDSDGTYTTNLGKINSYVEFRVTSNHAVTFPMSFSKRIKAYI